MTQKVVNSDNSLFFMWKKMGDSLWRETSKEKKSLKKQKRGFTIHAWSDKAFKGIVANRTLPSLPWGTPKSMFTVPLYRKTSCWIFPFI